LREAFDETSRWMGWLKNEFSHSLSPEPTTIGRFHRRQGYNGQASSAFAVDIAHPAWLSSGRWATATEDEYQRF
jgi:hypothetical protein